VTPKKCGCDLYKGYIYIYSFGKNGPEVTIFGWKEEKKERVKITIFRPLLG
jgi:hypothetical protein